MIAGICRAVGAPTIYTEEIAEEICDWVAAGGTLRAFCRQEGMPRWRTVYDWISAREDFRTRMELARELGADAIAEEALAIADTPQIGEIETQGPEGKITRREDMLGHRKLQVETRLKLLAKWHPKKYGEKLELGGALAVTPVLNILGSRSAGGLADE